MMMTFFVNNGTHLLMIADGRNVRSLQKTAWTERQGNFTASQVCL